MEAAITNFFIAIPFVRKIQVTKIEILTKNTRILAPLAVTRLLQLRAMLLG